MPRLVACFLLVTLSSIALPGMNGFIGEFLILLGAYPLVCRGSPSFAATGVILSAVYMLWMFQRVNYGEITNEKNRHAARICPPREWALMIQKELPGPGGPGGGGRPAAGGAAAPARHRVGR